MNIDKIKEYAKSEGFIDAEFLICLDGVNYYDPVENIPSFGGMPRFIAEKNGELFMYIDSDFKILDAIDNQKS